MNLFRKKYKWLLVTGLTFLFCCSGSIKSAFGENEYKWDITPFGSLCFWSGQTGVLGKNLKENGLLEIPQSGPSEWNIGLWWKEERDIDRIEVGYQGKFSESQIKATKIQYWFHTWPQNAPKGHSIEDNLDDPWQGRWLTANTDFKIKGNSAIYTFKPLSKMENPRADNLPGQVSYRRTLKVRLLYVNQPPVIQDLKMFSPTMQKKLQVRIQFDREKLAGKNISGRLEVFNGKIEHVSGWKWESNDKLTSKEAWKFQMKKRPKGILADLITALPSLPGSNDLTIVTVRSSEGTFSFSTNDLVRGPIYVPAYSAYISLASDTAQFIPSRIKKGETIREKLASEPEQTYERACREIPSLGVMEREGGGKLYLPLAPDASWQKFGFEWGGGFYMGKNETKAFGNELKRCLWKGNRFQWSVGTGKEPVYLRDDKNSHLSILDDYLPIAEVNWNQEGLNFKEEGFATLLEGPLSPYDEKRSEQTPAILMVKLSVSNPTVENKHTHIWLKGEPIDQPALHDLSLVDKIDGKSYIRAKIKLPKGVASADLKIIKDAVDIPLDIPANQTVSLCFSVPFVGDLSIDEHAKITALDYTAERQRVVNYWRDIVHEFTTFNVPEPKFNIMARSVIPHIRISTTKDPMSGLFMVPAASFHYKVFANESAFQTIYLDKIGDHQTAASYLETFLKMQGKDPMLGTYTGDQSAVFHGAKVSDLYNYTHQDYNLDHGTVLWALGEHYLMTRDAAWLEHAAPNMLKAAAWIIDQRNQTKVNDWNGIPVLHYGLLPAGHLEDNFDWGFWFATNAYACLGLQSTARAFRQAGLPQAEVLEQEARKYLEDIQSAVKRSGELAPVVRLRDNTFVPYVPTRVYQRSRYFGPMLSEYYSRYGKDTTGTTRLYRLSATREVLYGPMVLITTGIINPNDPLAGAILDDWEDNITMSSSLGQQIHGEVEDHYWFSRGGMVFQPNLQNPIKAYLLRNEIPAAIRNIYNSMVSCLYPDISAFTEEYHKWGLGSGPMYKIPDEARFLTRVTDLLVTEAGDELWLAPGTPRYWFAPGKIIRLYQTATVFGKVSFELKCGARSNTIEASLEIPENIPDGKVKLFVRSPFRNPIKSVTVNGKSWYKWDAAKETITLPSHEKSISVIVCY
jgi:hypothetical protein